MSKIGDPDDYYPNKQSTTEGGYVEERLSKLEYYQRDIKEILSPGEISFGSIPLGCRACNSIMPQSGIHLPLCEDCLKVLGKLSDFHRNTKFLF